MFNPAVNLGLMIGTVTMAVLLFRPRHGLFAALRRNRKLNERVLREDALKFLAEREASSRPATVAAIAGALDVSRDRASSIVAEMINAGQVDRTEAGYVITTRGRETALHLIRAHRLWELFLAERTGYERGEWHARADEQEHNLDRRAVRELEGRLGNPVFDPDGDPIPRKGAAISRDGVPLADLDEGDTATIVHLEDEPPSVYAELVAQELYPGLRVEVLESNRDRVRFWAGHSERALSPLHAANVNVVVSERRESDHDTSIGTLAELLPGRTAQVVEIDASCRGAERNRFLDLGVVPGARVTAEFRSAGKDPTAYRIRDALIALRAQQAHKIFVREVGE